MSYIVDTQVKTWGNGKAIRLSKELLAVAGFTGKEPIELIAESGQILIKKQPIKQKTLTEKLKEYPGFYEPTKEDQTWLSLELVGDGKW